MRWKILLVMLLGLGLAACETASTDMGSASGSGATGASSAPAGSSVSTNQLSSLPQPTGPRPGSEEEPAILGWKSL